MIQLGAAPTNHGAVQRITLHKINVAIPLCNYYYRGLADSGSAPVTIVRSRLPSFTTSSQLAKLFYYRCVTTFSSDAVGILTGVIIIVAPAARPAPPLSFELWL